MRRIEKDMEDTISLSGSVKDSQVFTRSYQLEMFQESLKRNSIVVMGTGTGKTHVAILRIMEELESQKIEKLIWFLTPTVPLCNQQFAIIRQQLPSVSARQITGMDNPDLWSSREIWNKVLGCHRVIVSTHAILSDALSHGFVTMDRLGLLIFDEAHHCNKQHPAHKIMEDFYHPLKDEKGAAAVPRVLGLTASPMFSVKEMHQICKFAIPKFFYSAYRISLIENNLDGVCIAPQKHREDLARFVHVPDFVGIYYKDVSISEMQSSEPVSASSSLEYNAIQFNEILEQYVQVAKQIDSVEPLLLANGFKSEDIKQFQKRAKHVFQELGVSSAELYITFVLTSLKTPYEGYAQARANTTRDNASYFLNKNISETSLSQWKSGARCTEIQVSDKAAKLIQFLQLYSKGEINGIIFVEQRVIAVMLQKLISAHPKTSHHSCGTFVGASNTRKKTGRLTDLVDLKHQAAKLKEFRLGECNIMIATSVLDEGIDVPSCNLVICFNVPANLKSFIQRRGRARDIKSKFVMFGSLDNIITLRQNWEAQEAQMKIKLQQERREIQRLERTEGDTKKRRFEVHGTDALLTLEDSISHLYHFCAKLSKEEFSDNKPIFKFFSQASEDGTPDLFQAQVILPSSVHPSIRVATGTEWWISQQQAKRDAAYESYISLYKHGLVNDNLLPQLGLSAEVEALSDTHRSKVHANVTVMDRVQNWDLAAEMIRLQPPTGFHTTSVEIQRPAKVQLRFHLLFPFRLPSFPKLLLTWTIDEEYLAIFRPGMFYEPGKGGPALIDVQKVNDIFLRPIYGKNMASNDLDVIPLISPCLDHTELARWRQANQGTTSAVDVIGKSSMHGHIVRSAHDGNIPRRFQNWADDKTLYFTSLCKWTNFLHQSQVVDPIRVDHYQEQNEEFLGSFTANSAVFDNLSSESVEISLLLPSLLRYIWKYYIASRAAATVLPKVFFDDFSSLVHALTAPSTGEKIDHRNLGCIGHLVSKYLMTLFLFAKNGTQHEQHLHDARVQLLSRQRLVDAAIRTQLAQYIITAAFVPSKWAPYYVKGFPQADTGGFSVISSIVLIDAVEAVIGAAYLDGGIQNAAKALHTFLPEYTFTLPPTVVQKNRKLIIFESSSNTYFDKLQKLIGYRFQNTKLLSQAITHPSVTHDPSRQSYQRLRFLGNTVIDMVVVRCFMKSKPLLEEHKMQLIRSAFQNSILLGFLCLELNLTESFSEIVEQRNSSTYVAVQKTRRVGLCEFLRFQNADLPTARDECMQRHQHLRQEICTALTRSQKYPWTLLCRLRPRKFFSDMIRSIFGAILVDSDYSLSSCEQFAKHIGLTGYIDRSIRDNVDLCHPKTKLAEITNGNSKLEYAVRMEDSLSEKFTCTVSIDDMTFEVTGAETEDEAKTQGAETTLATLLEAADMLSRVKIEG